jgi:23S rRNA (pseudouridine1915-N3)-methyltransferase
MRLAVLAVGRLKTPYWLDAQKEYLSRIRRYAPTELVEIKDRVGKGQEDLSAMSAEGEAILEKAADWPALIALTPEGSLLDSLAWSKTLGKLSETYSRLAFVIGGPVGISSAVLKKSVLKLSLSPMTFPHEMARVVFLEQLYRALTLLNGEKYHK